MDPEFEKRLEALAEERTAFDKSEAQQAKDLMRENLVPAVLSIVNIAMHSPTEKLRYDAAKYIVERNLGPLTAASSTSDEKDPIEALLQDILASAEGNN